MSLVGNLEDLGLGDILQIVSLSRKSGVLSLAWGEVKGKIIFKDGQVVTAVSSAGHRTLGALLAEHGVVAKFKSSELDRLIAGQSDNTRIKKAVADAFHVSPAVIDEAVREQIEGTVFHFFTWPEGTFSFDLQEIEGEISSLDPGQRAFIIEPGLSPQFLAMEGARLQDERKRGQFESPVGPALKFSGGPPDSSLTERPDPEPAEISSSPSETAEEASTAAESSAAPAKPREVEEDFSSVADALAYYEGQSPGQNSSPVPAPEPAKVGAAALEPPAPEPFAQEPELPDLVIIDDDPFVLESMVHHLSKNGYHSRTFTEVKAGINYLQKLMDMGMKPRVVISDLIIPGLDKKSTLGGLELLDLARKINPSLPVYLMTDYENQPAREKADELGARFFFTKPKASQLEPDYSSPELLNFIQVLSSALENEEKMEARTEKEPAVKPGVPLVDLGDELRREFGEEVKPITPENGGKTITPSRGLHMLKTMISELNDPSSNGQITLLILRFASELMNRAIIFLVAKNRLAGLGQFGIEMEGVDPQKHVRQIRIPLNQPSIFREAIQKRMPLKKTLKNSQWNDYLVETLGGMRPAEVFIAPIIAGGKIAALIYGDNVPEDKEIGDTESLEIFLAQAGLAMEKALLEMKLREIENPARKRGET